MILLEKIHTNDERYAFVESLLNSAFPQAERRDTAMQRNVTDNNPLFSCYLIKNDTETVGFITVWDFEQFCYIEHFAIDERFRNSGCGQKAVRTLMCIAGRPFVLEVEMPVDEISCRRIGFYQRQGFKVWDKYDYIQPPYRKDGETLPMRLMASEGLDPDLFFNTVKRRLYKDVYQTDEFATFS